MLLRPSGRTPGKPGRSPGERPRARRSPEWWRRHHEIDRRRPQVAGSAPAGSVRFDKIVEAISTIPTSRGQDRAGPIA